MSFEEWMRIVDNVLLNNCGMLSDDLPDYCYYDSWKAGDSPFECAEQAIEYAKEAL